MTSPHTTAIRQAAESICEQYNLSHAESHVAILIAQRLAPLLEQADRKRERDAVHAALVKTLQPDFYPNDRTDVQMVEDLVERCWYWQGEWQRVNNERDQALARAAAAEGERNAAIAKLAACADAESALQAKLAACEAERLEQARLNGMGSEREARLMARVKEVEGLLREAVPVVRSMAEWCRLNPTDRETKGLTDIADRISAHLAGSKGDGHALTRKDGGSDGE